MGITIFIASIIIIGLLFLTFFIVKQQTAVIIERFGRLNKICRPGLNWKIPLIDRISARVSLRIQQLNVPIETKTKDNVFVNVIISVQYVVIEDKIAESFL